jgi:hypothetical protein
VKRLNKKAREPWLNAVVSSLVLENETDEQKYEEDQRTHTSASGQPVVGVGVVSALAKKDVHEGGSDSESEESWASSDDEEEKRRKAPGPGKEASELFGLTEELDGLKAKERVEKRKQQQADATNSSNSSGPTVLGMGGGLGLAAPGDLFGASSGGDGASGGGGGDNSDDASDNDHHHHQQQEQEQPVAGSGVQDVRNSKNKKHSGKHTKSRAQKEAAAFVQRMCELEHKAREEAAAKAKASNLKHNGANGVGAGSGGDGSSGGVEGEDEAGEEGVTSLTPGSSSSSGGGGSGGGLVKTLRISLTSFLGLSKSKNGGGDNGGDEEAGSNGKGGHRRKSRRASAKQAQRVEDARRQRQREEEEAAHTMALVQENEPGRGPYAGLGSGVVGTSMPGQSTSSSLSKSSKKLTGKALDKSGGRGGGSTSSTTPSSDVGAALVAAGVLAVPLEELERRRLARLARLGVVRPCLVELEDSSSESSGEEEALGYEVGMRVEVKRPNKPWEKGTVSSLPPEVEELEKQAKLERAERAARKAAEASKEAAAEAAEASARTAAFLLGLPDPTITPGSEAPAAGAAEGASGVGVGFGASFGGGGSSSSGKHQSSASLRRARKVERQERRVVRQQAKRRRRKLRTVKPLVLIDGWKVGWSVVGWSVGLICASMSLFERH